jgi:hypothetical protein
VKIIFYDILDILTRQPCFYRNEYKTVLPDLAEGVTTYLNIELIKLNSASWEKLPSGLLLALIEPVAELQCKRTVIDGDQLAVEYEGSLEDGTDRLCRATAKLSVDTSWPWPAAVWGSDSR